MRGELNSSRTVKEFVVEIQSITEVIFVKQEALRVGEVTSRVE